MGTEIAILGHRRRRSPAGVMDRVPVRASPSRAAERLLDRIETRQVKKVRVVRRRPLNVGEVEHDLLRRPLLFVVIELTRS